MTDDGKSYESYSFLTYGADLLFFTESVRNSPLGEYMEKWGHIGVLGLKGLSQPLYAMTPKEKVTSLQGDCNWDVEPCEIPADNFSGAPMLMFTDIFVMETKGGFMEIYNDGDYSGLAFKLLYKLI